MTVYYQKEKGGGVVVMERRPNAQGKRKGGWLRDGLLETGRLHIESADLPIYRSGGEKVDEWKKNRSRGGKRGGVGVTNLAYKNLVAVFVKTRMDKKDGHI